MCRYGFKSYKNHYACFNCLHGFARNGHEGACPNCGDKMHSMGPDFKVPPHRDVKQWKKVEKLYKNGFRFGSCGCNGPGYRPAELSQVDQFLRDEEREKLERDPKRRFLLNLDNPARPNRKPAQWQPTKSKTS
jgi:hypothetical protein